MTSEKACTKCGEVKPLADFHRRSNRGSGYVERCKSCVAEYARAYHKKNKARHNENSRRYYWENRERLLALSGQRHTTLERTCRAHHITVETYQAMLDAQGGRCAICRVEPDAFCIDHDHACCPGRNSCGKCVRSLLCRGCNVKVGVLESPLRPAAQAYIDQWSKTC